MVYEVHALGVPQAEVMHTTRTTPYHVKTSNLGAYLFAGQSIGSLCACHVFWFQGARFPDSYHGLFIHSFGRLGGLEQL